MLQPLTSLEHLTAIFNNNLTKITKVALLTKRRYFRRLPWLLVITIWKWQSLSATERLKFPIQILLARRNALL